MVRVLAGLLSKKMPSCSRPVLLLSELEKLLVIERGAHAIEFIPLSLLSIVSTMVLWESSQWLENNVVQSTG